MDRTEDARRYDRRMSGMYRMQDLLELLVREGAEELRLFTDRPPALTLKGKPLAIDVPALTGDNVVALFESIATEQQLAELEKCGDLRFIYVLPHSTSFAVTATQQGKALNITLKRLGR